MHGGTRFGGEPAHVFARRQAGGEPSLLFDDLVRNAPGFSKSWLQAAFVLLVVGYGTKMGLAPMHTWKPDAYGEAPGIVGALLAGAMTSCAFLALARVLHVLTAAGEGAFVPTRWFFQPQVTG